MGWGMSIAVTCGQCGQSFRIKDEYAGRKTKCPACSAPLEIPASEYEALPADAIEPMPTVVPPASGSTPSGSKTPLLVAALAGVSVALVLVAGVLAFVAFRVRGPEQVAVQVNQPPREQPLPAPAIVKTATAPASVTPPVDASAPAAPVAPPASAPSTPAPPGVLPSNLELRPGLELPDNLPPEVRAQALAALAELARKNPGLVPSPIPKTIPSPSTAKDIPYEWKPVAVELPALPVEAPAEYQVEIPLLGPARSINIAYPTAPSPYVLTFAPTAERDETLFELWDLRTNTRKGEMKVPQAPPRSVVLSSDGALVAFESGKELLVWSTVSGALISKLTAAETRGFTHFDFLGNDRLILRQPTSVDFSIWDAKTGQKINEVPMGGLRLLSAIAYSPDQKHLAVVSDNALHVKGLKGQLANRIPLPQLGDRSSPRCLWLTFSPDGRELAGLFDVGGEQALACWELAGGTVVAQHKFNATKSYHSHATQVPLAWLKAGGGWLVYGNKVIDRQHGGPVWTLPTVSGETHYPIRPLDDHTILAVRGSGDQQTIESIALPQNEIAAGIEMIAAGGTLQDLGLPAMKKADWSAVFDVSNLVVPGKWLVNVEAVNLPAVDPIKPLELGRPESAVQQIFFGSPASSQVYIWSRRDGLELPTAKLRSHSLEQYDWQTGQRVGSSELPFEAELLAVRGDGKLLAVSPYANRERIDVVEAATGKHIAGWKPLVDDKDKYGRMVTAAEFIGAEHVIVASKSDKFSVWKLPECKAVLAGALGSSGQGVVVSPDQKYLAYFRGGSVRIVEVATGKASGECLLRNDQAAGLASLNLGKAAAFHPQGDRLAYVTQVADTTKFPPLNETAPGYRSPSSAYGRYGRPYVPPPGVPAKEYRIPDDAFSGIVGIWNLRTGEKEKEFAIPRTARRVAWCGAGHLLIDGTYLVDLEREMLTWKYSVKHGKIQSNVNDSRTWYTTANVKGQSLLLTALALPDAEVVKATATAQSAKPTFGSGMPVQLTVNLQNLPTEREKSRDELATALKRKLVLNGNEVAETSRVKILLNIEQRRTNDAIKLRVQGLANAGEVVIPVTEMLCNLGIVSDSGELLWSDAQTIKTDEHSDARPMLGADAKPEPQSTDIKQLLADRQWAAILEWLEQVKLPGAIYPPAYREGMGESILTPSGPEAVRSNPADASPTGDRKT